MDAATPPPTAPPTLAGRYRLVKQIGKGGFGVVEQYKDLFTDSYVAIKTVPAHFVAQETKRLVREVDIMIHLFNAHPHVMSIFEIFVTRKDRQPSAQTCEFDEFEEDVRPTSTPATEAAHALQNLLAQFQSSEAAAAGRGDGGSSGSGAVSGSNNSEQLLSRYFQAMRNYLATVRSDDEFDLHIVMPLMKGDLFYFCKRNSSMMGPATKPDYLSQVCVVFAFQLCFGLDYLHKCNIVHRDMKPDNVLVWLDPTNAYRSTAVIADFGLARDAMASETFYICTRHYRPPEVITNTSKGETTIDVWSLGCIFYELVTGKSLFNLPTALNSRGQWEGVKASQQLEIILNTLGTPSVADIDAFMPPGNAQSYLRKSRGRVSGLRESILTNWRLSGVEGEEREKWVDLISSCLRFFPQQRPSMEALCAHALFRQYNVLYGENVKQYTVKQYQPVAIPQHATRSDMKQLVLTLAGKALDITSSVVTSSTDVECSTASDPSASPNTSPPSGQHQPQSNPGANLLAEDHPSLLGAAAAPPRLRFPVLESHDLRLRYQSAPVETDQQVDEAIDEVLNQMELYTHDAGISRQLRSLLTYFAALKQLAAPEEMEPVVEHQYDESCDC